MTGKKYSTLAVFSCIFAVATAKAQPEFLKPLKETGKDTGKVNIEMVMKNLLYFMFTHLFIDLFIHSYNI